jgi:hypothetical protein
MESPFSRVPLRGVAQPFCRTWRRGDLMSFRYVLSVFCRGAAIGAALTSLNLSAAADPIRHPTAVFAGLDKTTGRIINFDVAIDETVQFRTLQVTPRVCNTRPQTEAPQTTSFVEVDEQTPKPDQKRDPNANAKTEPKLEVKRIFSGWMFAASPGLHGVEHPVYDVWLVDCKGGKEVAQQPSAPDAATPAPPPAEGKRSGKARKVEPAAPAAVEAQPIGPADEPVFGQTPATDPLAEPDAQPQKPKPAEKRKERRKKRKDAAPADAAAPEPGADPAMPF